MTGTLLHFESMVPINDLNIKPSQRKRLMRVEHVYWIWMRNPYLDTFSMFKQLCKDGDYADRSAAWTAARKDQMLLDFVIEHVRQSSRRKDEAKVRAAAEQAIRIGMETDNAVALTKGGKLLYEVAGLAQPESEQADMSKVMFLPPVVTTNVRDVDDTKEDVDDAEMKRIMAKYGGFVDEKVKDINEMVEVMATKRTAAEDAVIQHQTGQEDVVHYGGYFEEARDDQPLTAVRVEKEISEEHEQDRQ